MTLDPRVRSRRRRRHGVHAGHGGDLASSTTPRPAVPGTRPIRVAMIGQKGLPATYGGIEHHVEELGSRLADLGFEVSVYCRASYSDTEEQTYRGMRLVRTPTIASKHLDATVHAFTSTAHAVARGADIVHYHALGPGLSAPIARYLSPAKVVLTVHGLDHQRGKWSLPARLVLGTAYWMSGWVPTTVVTVSRALADHYRQKRRVEPVHIPNGVAAPRPGPLTERLRALGLTPGSYVLAVGRVVPEKRTDLLVRVAASLPAGMKVVLAGDSAFEHEYFDSLRSIPGAAERVVFTGFSFGEELGGLYSNAAAFCQPSDLEGLPLTLLEALSHGLPVVASDISPHLEVLEPEHRVPHGPHRVFRRGDADDLRTQLLAVLGDATAAERAAAVAPAVLRDHDWDASARDLAQLYVDLTTAHRPTTAP